MHTGVHYACVRVWGELVVVVVHTCLACPRARVAAPGPPGRCTALPLPPPAGLRPPRLAWPPGRTCLAACEPRTSRALATPRVVAACPQTPPHIAVWSAGVLPGQPACQCTLPRTRRARPAPPLPLRPPSPTSLQVSAQVLSQLVADAAAYTKGKVGWGGHPGWPGLAWPAAARPAACLPACRPLFWPAACRRTCGPSSNQRAARCQPGPRTGRMEMAWPTDSARDPFARTHTHTCGLAACHDVWGSSQGLARLPA